MYIYGKNVATEYINSGKKINRILLSDNFDDRNLKFLIKKTEIEPKIMPKYEIEKLVGKLNQGIILDIPDFEYVDFRELLNDEIVIILDHIEDPHNFGAIIRTALAANIKSIIIPKNRSTDVNATVYKTSAGSILKVKIAQVTNLSQTMDILKKSGFWIIGTDMEGEDYNLIDYSGKIVLVIGNEGDGMARIVKEKCDFVASIPMSEESNSLNASVSAGLVMFKAIEKRKKV